MLHVTGPLMGRVLGHAASLLMEARADRVLGLVISGHELVEVELSVRAMVGNYVLNVLMNAGHVHVLPVTVLVQHDRNHAHRLCTCVACVSMLVRSVRTLLARHNTARHHSMSHQISENWSAPGERQGLWEEWEWQGLMSGTESATETVGGDGSTAIKVGHVKIVLRRMLVHVALLELGELVRVDRRVPVRGVREVLELQHLCSGRGAPQTHIAICAEARKRAGRLWSLPDRTWSCGGLQRMMS